MDYPDISHLPPTLCISIEALEPYIDRVLAYARPHQVQELEYLVQETVRYLCVSSNYTDNIALLVNGYAQEIKTVEDRATFSLYSDFFYKLAQYLHSQFVALHVYALDDTCYYEFDQCLGRHLIVLKRKQPNDFWLTLNA